MADRRFYLVRSKPSDEAVGMFLFDRGRHRCLGTRGNKPNIIRYTFCLISEVEVDTYLSLGVLSFGVQDDFYDDEWQIE